MVKVKVAVQNLSKSFNGIQVLSNINLEVKEGESFVIIGPSGCGKSVLIKSIIGILLPDPGSVVMIGGEDVTFTPIIKRTNMLGTFAVLFQGGALFDSLQVWENVAFMSLQAGMKPSEAKEMAMHKLSLVELDASKMHLYPAELSGGMQKRVALARAIALNPSLIFFDEPTTGLDPIMSQTITALIGKLSRELGAATVTITHDLKCVKGIADTIAMIHDGGIIWSGNITELENSQDPIVSRFIGNSHGT
ncbi:ATP-binding cassette domain-containing protein [Rickettsiales endosymbiont of Peranema trichophorum]|uniref:ABC transporter ATP-binding protein n=1 Tax=Rickettsiales endosymbiont of Peranema trichophorum TaxID=2486577 RepID=UPI0010234752|nr:ATP-binding cassette domain-containing protein [Rickettsiales endosymbiont of Peranema trichophorum]RZI47204.1 ATP-binding cassette domain-containing protein [Rickettsiales endosymbiont of Peranema trichophorum]